jgi:DNA polymerase-3 subunit gamma/tau
MLRTHGELGYKQEQRFHLELGLLKMSHAQRLIPIEQLLSDAAAAPAVNGPKPTARPSIVGSASSSETRRPEPTSAGRQNFVSPFAADSARKGTPRQESSFDPSPPTGPRIVAAAAVPEPVIMGSAAPAPQREILPEPVPDGSSDRRDVASYVFAGATKPGASEPRAQAELSAAQTQLADTAPQPQVERLQSAVLQALTDGNQRVLVSMLSAGEWSVQANEVVIKIAESQTVIDMSVSPEAKRLAIASASGLLGRAMKLRVVPGAAVAPQESKRNGTTQPAAGPGGRGRAEQDPVVRRMQEKFGAQVRTVIDYRDKR